MWILLILSKIRLSNNSKNYFNWFLPCKFPDLSKKKKKKRLGRCGNSAWIFSWKTHDHFWWLEDLINVGCLCFCCLQVDRSFRILWQAAHYHVVQSFLIIPLQNKATSYSYSIKLQTTSDCYTEVVSSFTCFCPITMVVGEDHKP